MKLLFQSVDESLPVTNVFVLGTTQDTLRIVARDVLKLDQLLVQGTLGLQVSINDASLPILVEVAGRSLMNVFPRLLMFVCKLIFCLYHI